MLQKNGVISDWVNNDNADLSVPPDNGTTSSEQQEENEAMLSDTVNNDTVCDEPNDGNVITKNETKLSDETVNLPRDEEATILNELQSDDESEQSVMPSIVHVSTLSEQSPIEATLNSPQENISNKEVDERVLHNSHNDETMLHHEPVLSNITSRAQQETWSIIREQEYKSQSQYRQRLKLKISRSRVPAFNINIQDALSSDMFQPRVRLTRIPDHILAMYLQPRTVQQSANNIQLVVSDVETDSDSSPIPITFPAMAVKQERIDKDYSQMLPGVKQETGEMDLISLYSSEDGRSQRYGGFRRRMTRGIDTPTSSRQSEHGEHMSEYSYRSYQQPGHSSEMNSKMGDSEEYESDDENDEDDIVREQFVDPLDCSEDETEEEHDVVDPLFCGNNEFRPSSSSVNAEKRIEEEGTTPSHSQLRTRNRDRPYKCTRCNQTFSLPSALTLHLGSHTGENPYVCDECGKSFSVYSRLVTHRNTHIDRMCSVCGESFIDSTDLENHVATQHPDMKIFYCHHCDATFTDISQLDKHLETHGGVEKRHTCRDCGKTFRNRGALVTHTRTHRPFKCIECGMTFLEYERFSKHLKTHIGTYKCNQCGKTFPERYRLRRHEKTHFGKNNDNAMSQVASRMEHPSRFTPRLHVCGECDESFVNVNDLEAHLKLHRKTVFECSECDKSYSKHGYLLNHYYTVHSRKDSFNCDKCDKVFNKQKDLKQHVETHHPSHRCNICGQSFTSYDELVTHLVLHNNEMKFEKDKERFTSRNSTSSPMVIIPYSAKDGTFPQFEGVTNRGGPENSKPYPCEKCGKSFGKYNLLLEHMQSHEDLEFQCKQCHKCFSEHDELIHHIMTHVGRPPFKCQICPKNFPHRYRLIRHLKTHLGDKMYSCTQCNKSFSEVYYLDVHMRSHTGERPYQCTECDSNFTMRTSLNTHIKLRHPQKSFKCHICGLRFTMHGALITHLKKHAAKKALNTVKKPTADPFPEGPILASLLQTEEQRQFHCRLCGRGFNYTSNLRRHIVTVHKRKSSIGCLIDTKPLAGGYSQPSGRNLVNNIDGNEGMSGDTPPNTIERKIFRCMECGNGYGSSGNLSRHLREKHRLNRTPKTRNFINSAFSAIPPSQQSHACFECGKTFSDRISLRKHLKRHAAQKLVSFKMFGKSNSNHTVVGSDTSMLEKTHKCMQCDKSFTERINLQRHIALQHTKKVRGDGTPDSGSLDEDSNTGIHKLYECPECGKSFHYKTNLSRHMKTHTPKETVGLPIIRIPKLNVSDSIHLKNTSLEQFKCQECGKSFNFRSQLAKHMATHIKPRYSSPTTVERNSNDEEDDEESSPNMEIKQECYICKLCGKCFNCSSNLRRHFKIHTLEKIPISQMIATHNVVIPDMPFKCEICGKVFIANGDLRKHVKMTHFSKKKRKPSFGRYKCTLCTKSFQDSYKLKRHMQAQKHNKTIHKCSVCDHSFNTVMELNEHLDTHKTAKIPTQQNENVPEKKVVGPVVNGPFQCTKCGKSFLHRPQLYGHLKMHSSSGKTYRCNVCGKVFPNSNMMKRHMVTHSSALSFHCTSCPERFRSKAKLIEHTATTHPESNTNKSHSPNPNADESNLNPNTARAEPVNSETTNYAMVDHSELSADTVEKTKNVEEEEIEEDASSGTGHPKDGSEYGEPNSEGEHGNDTPLKNERKLIKVNSAEKFKCKLCGKCFPNNHKLTRHLNTKKHTIKWPHRCKICGEATSNKSRLQTHLAAVHSVGKKYQCHLCEKFFPDGSKLKRHLNTQKHTSSVPRVCHYCNMPFVNQFELSRHLRIHVEEKQYQCRECDKSFSDQGNLIKHMKTHDLNEEVPGEHTESFSGNSLLKESDMAEKPFITHSTEWPHVCIECGKGFWFKSKLNSHMKIHVEESFHKPMSYGEAFQNTDLLQTNSVIRYTEGQAAASSQVQFVGFPLQPIKDEPFDENM